MWSKEPTPRPGAEAAATTTITPVRPAEERRVTAWVGKSVVFRGDLISSEDMTIDGRVEGTIEVRDHALTIGPDAHIAADVVAKVVTILGKVIGSVTAQDKIEIRDTGSIEGDIQTPRLIVAEGGSIRGKVDMGAKAASAEGARSTAARA